MTRKHILPQFLRMKMKSDKWIRNEFLHDHHLSLQLAENEVDYQTALQLIRHRKGYNANFFDLLPQSKMVLLKYKDLLIGTLRMTFDSEIGLPSDENYAQEIQLMRKSQRGLVEISDITVDSGFKHQTTSILHLLMKYTLQYLTNLNINQDLLYCPHPSLTSFFEDEWGFQPAGPEVRPSSSPISRKQLLTLTDLRKILSGQRKHTKISFLLHQDFRFSLPEPHHRFFAPMLQSKAMDEFALEKSNLFDSLNHKQKKFFLEMYLQFFGYEPLEKFLMQEKEYHLKEFRIPTRTQAQVKWSQMNLTGQILDISTQGCYLQIEKEIDRSFDQVVLQFRWGDQILEVPGQVLWKNQNQLNRYPMGYGIRFEKTEESLKRYFKGFQQVGNES